MAYGLLHMRGVDGQAGWRWMFLVEVCLLSFDFDFDFFFATIYSQLIGSLYSCNRYLLFPSDAARSISDGELVQREEGLVH
jgi:hypothetical protein